MSVDKTPPQSRHVIFAIKTEMFFVFRNITAIVWFSFFLFFSYPQDSLAFFRAPSSLIPASLGRRRKNNTRPRSPKDETHYMVYVIPSTCFERAKKSMRRGVCPRFVGPVVANNLYNVVVPKQQISTLAGFLSTFWQRSGATRVSDLEKSIR